MISLRMSFFYGSAERSFHYASYLRMEFTSTNSSFCGDKDKHSVWNYKIFNR
jgi:hypothetical protein